jgi:hypothetical protein
MNKEKPPMNHDLLEQLNRRLTEHHESLRGRIDDLAQEMRAQHRMVIERIDAHEDYHRREEHRWGLPALARRHLLRLAAGAFALGALLWPDTGGNAAHWIQWLHRLLQINIQ